MKKLYYSTFTYLILALASGLLWREITKILDVSEKTSLSVVHTHLFSVGFMMFLIFMILEKTFDISQSKRFKSFFILYHIGVGLSTLMMLVRGMVSIQVIRGEMTLTKAIDSSIAGFAGMGHMILTVALIMLMLILKDRLFTPKKR